MDNQNLGVVDILKKSVLVSARNFNFIVFTLITSFPLFCFLVYHEFLLQKFLSVTSETLKPSYDYFGYYWRDTLDIARKLNEEIFFQFLQLGFLYLVPIHLLEFCIVPVIVDLASKICREDKQLSLKDMIHRPIEIVRLRGIFVTYVYVTFLSSSTLLGLTWLVTLYFVILRNSMYYVIFTLVCGASFVSLLGLHLALSSEWNMSVVISVSEGVYGPAALALSSSFSERNHRRGLILMLVFFVWGVVLRLPCLYFGCYKQGYGIVAQISLYCLGNALKWVACVVYFVDCKKRNLEKKIDEDVGVGVKTVDA